MAGESYPKSGILNEQVYALHDVMKPIHAQRLFKRYGDQGVSNFQLYRQMGRELPVSNYRWHGHEDNQHHATVTVRTTVGDAGAGNDRTFTIAAADIDTSNRFYVRVGDIVTIPGTDQVQAHVYSIDVTTPADPVVTLKPVSATETIGGLTAADILPITNGAWGAGTGQPESVNTGTVERTFYTQIIKDTSALTGDQFATTEWFQYYDVKGGVKGWYTEGTAYAEYRLAIKMDGALTFGQERTNTTMLVAADATHGAGNAINTTKGLWTWARELGSSLAYTPGAFVIEDFEDIGLYMRTQHINSTVALIDSGVKLSSDINRVARAYFVTDTGSTVLTELEDTYFGGARNVAGVLNFKVINLGDGFKYMIRVNDNLSNPKTFGATGQDIDKKGLILPVTSFKDPSPSGKGGKIDNFGTRYRASRDGSYSRRMEMWDVKGAGGGSGSYVTQYDEANFYFRSEIGMEAYKLNQTVLIEE